MCSLVSLALEKEIEYQNAAVITIDLDKIAKFISLNKIILQGDDKVSLKVIKDGKLINETNEKSIDLKE